MAQFATSLQFQVIISTSKLLRRASIIKNVVQTGYPHLAQTAGAGALQLTSLRMANNTQKRVVSQSISLNCHTQIFDGTLYKA